MSKKLEKLADEMINLSPEDGQKLAMIIRAKVMPKQAKQQQQQGVFKGAKGGILKMRSGGKIDGLAMRGKTRGRYV